jgi:quercetin dioxygenase-like cupin family protein
MSIHHCLTLFGVVAMSAASVLAQAGKKADLRTPSELKWTDAPEVKGVQRAVVWGNGKKSSHGSFAKFPGGFTSPLHTHISDGRSVVVSGTVIETLEGQSPKELPAGSYFFIPGGLKHTTACKAGAECVLYTHWSGAFDLKPEGK